MELPKGLAADRVAQLGDLIADIAGATVTSRPYLAPALLFADKAVQAEIGMPVAEAHEILVQDYQAVSHTADLPLNTALKATCRTTAKGSTTELHIDLAGCTTLVTALRRVPRQDLSAIKATRFHDTRALGSLAMTGPLIIRQAQVDRYLSLSGDGNPIHHDPGAARSLGLANPIVPGLLLVSTVQPTSAHALPGARLHGLKARFMAPLCVSDRFHIAVQSRGTADGLTRLRAGLFADNARALAIADMQFMPDSA